MRLEETTHLARAGWPVHAQVLYGTAPVWLRPLFRLGMGLLVSRDDQPVNGVTGAALVLGEFVLASWEPPPERSH